jgi:hypothetical protein
MDPSTPLLPSGRRAGDVDPRRNQVPRGTPLAYGTIGSKGNMKQEIRTGLACHKV